MLTVDEKIKILRKARYALTDGPKGAQHGTIEDRAATLCTMGALFMGSVENAYNNTAIVEVAHTIAEATGEGGFEQMERDTIPNLVNDALTQTIDYLRHQ